MRPAYSSFFVFYVNECTKAGNYGKLFHRNNERMYAHEKGYYKLRNNAYFIMKSLQKWERRLVPGGAQLKFPMH